MLSDGDIDRAAADLAAYQSNAALPKILETYATVLADFQRLKSDYEEERNARERYKQIAKRQERNPFVLVLIDGDGYAFHDTLVRDGADGGRRAAQLLDESIKNSLRAKGLENCEITVRIYANVAGLSKALGKAGLLGHESRSLTPFIAGFNRSYGLSDFVDAGTLKENADFKLRAMLRLYADNAQCKHIYFAACHDVGYISELTPHVSDKSRFTLVETPGVRFHDEFRKLDLGVERLPGVFRTSPLDPTAAQQPRPKTGGASLSSSLYYDAPIPIHNERPKAGKIPCSFYAKGLCRNGDQCSFAHGTANKTTSNWRSERSPPKPSNFDSLPHKSDIPEDCVVVNDEGHRLDPLMAPGSIEASKHLRMRGRRICNDFHLLGACRNDVDCEYDHSPLDAAQRDGAEALSRSLPCPRRGNCMIVDCIKGHVCQLPHCIRRGGKDFCRIPIGAHMQDFATIRYVPGTRPTRSGRESISLEEEEDDNRESPLETTTAFPLGEVEGHTSRYYNGDSF